MEIPHTCKKLRYLLNPKSLYSLVLTSELISCYSSSKTPISTINPKTSCSPSKDLAQFHYRSCSTSSSDSNNSYSRKQSNFTKDSRGFGSKDGHMSILSKHKSDFRNRHLVEVIKRDGNDMEYELDEMGLLLSLDLVSEIFWALNTDGVSGLRFFNWVRAKQVPFYRNSDFCSLAIDNLGRVEDYKLMFHLLTEYSRQKLCLTERAFAFLPIFSSNPALVKGSILKVTEMLNKVGGSCRNSGIFALIKMLCTLYSFDLAMVVMEETARRTSYYNVLIWAKCRNCRFQDAFDLFDEMKSFGCDPNANSYNYLLSSLCKNSKTEEACKLFRKMQEFGYVPDAVTFEVIIYHACRLGRLDFAIEFLNQMVSSSIGPRHTTHAAIIKGYFYCNRYQEAYKYVIDMCDKCKDSANVNYSLLASLLQRSKRVVEARDILVDMMEKGLKPNFPVYMKVMKDLHKSGMGDLVADIKSRFSKFQKHQD